jgi:hypothetical protein
MAVMAGLVGRWVSRNVWVSCGGSFDGGGEVGGVAGSCSGVGGVSFVWRAMGWRKLQACGGARDYDCSDSFFLLNLDITATISTKHSGNF